MPSDVGLQALLDVPDNGRAIRIIRRDDGGSSLNSAYYVQVNASAGAVAGGKAMWVNTVTADSDATKDTAIRAALGVP